MKKSLPVPLEHWCSDSFCVLDPLIQGGKARQLLYITPIPIYRATRRTLKVIVNLSVLDLSVNDTL